MLIIVEPVGWTAIERFTNIQDSFVNSSVIPLSHVVGEQHMFEYPCYE